MTGWQDNVRHCVLATAGHVDHGKSSLVRVLTGTEPDRLPEERARGITIDLGFAHLALAGPGGAMSVGIVDVPGHEDFVRNMVAGVGSVDAALLVVAADDGWMPQTEEHLQILSYLGVRAAVVALTKCDLVDDVGPAVAAVRERLAGTVFESAAVVPTSVPRGIGLDALRGALGRALSAIAAPVDVGKPRLPVDRVFCLKGIGTVATGTLTGGGLSRGQAVVVHPGGAATRIRAMQSHNRDTERGAPGSRVAVNLPDLQPSASHDARTAATIGRGDVVTVAPLGLAGRHVYALLTRSPRPIGAAAGAPALKHNARVRLHHGTAGVAARLRLLGAAELAPGRRCLAHLSLGEAVFAFVGDRFVLRDASQRHTLAGGIVLDPDAPARPRAAHVPGLEARAGALHDATTLVATEISRLRVAPAASLLIKSALRSEAIAAALAAARGGGAVVPAGDWAVDAKVWAAVRAAAVAAVDAVHGAQPEQVGLPLTALQAALKVPLKGVAGDGVAAVTEALLRALCSDGFARTGAAVHRAGHQPALPPRLAAAGQEILDRLAGRPFDPPSRKDLCRTDAAWQALRFLIATGRAVELTPELVMCADAYRRASAAVREQIGAHGAATVTQLKAALGTTRRTIVPLLERLDRDGVTRRNGDLRSLR